MFQDRISVLFAAITLVFIQCCTAGNITNLSVPRWVRNGTEDRVLLDCEYNYTLNEEKFVLKWYFNDDRQAAYQWIPNLNSRSFSDQFSPYADWEHYLRDADKFNKYRQIILRRPTTEFTGEYKCHVISKRNIDQKTAFMTVYAPARNIRLHYETIKADKTLNISCEVDGVFPKPEVELFYVMQGKEPKELDVNEDYFERTENSYRIGVSTLIPLSDLDKETDSDFSCIVTIDPEVYQDEKKITFHPDRELTAIGKLEGGNTDTSSGIFSSPFLLTLVFLISYIS